MLTALLINNGLMYLFSNIKYQLSGQEIESIFHPGQETTLLNLLRCLDDFENSHGLNKNWFQVTHTAAHLENNTGFKIRQNYIIRKPEPKGTFSFRVPLRHILDFVTITTKLSWFQPSTHSCEKRQ